MSTPEDLKTDAIEELETEYQHFIHESEGHDEFPKIGECWICQQHFEEDAAEHAWMGRAVKTWTGGNPYAPSDPQAPQRDWYVDDSGYVKADA
jgi:hypothetical protein